MRSTGDTKKERREVEERTENTLKRGRGVREADKTKGGKSQKAQEGEEKL